MKIFNAFQLVILLCVMPHLIAWLSSQDFRGASAAFYAAICIYIVQLGFTTVAYVEFFESK